MKKIPIGTLIKGDANPAMAIRALAPAGFECFSLSFWEGLGGADLLRLADGVAEAAGETGTFISALSVYGNPLRDDERGAATGEALNALLNAAPRFGCGLVSCFAGRLPGTSVKDSLPAWKRYFDPLAEKAEASGLRIAFENCRMGDTGKTGAWNIAINPDSWELMFDAIPSPALGLEWEPCHQVEALADPYSQLEAWFSKIFHIHGKDARIDKRLLAARGLYGSKRWAASCFPGNGDTDWRPILDFLGNRDYTGTIDIEGWNDAEWSGERELEGQARALAYLKSR